MHKYAYAMCVCACACRLEGYTYIHEYMHMELNSCVLSLSPQLVHVHVCNVYIRAYTCTYIHACASACLDMDVGMLIYRSYR